MSKAISTTTSHSDDSKPIASSKAGAAEKTSTIPRDAIDRKRINTQKIENVLLIWLDGNIDKDSEDSQSTVAQLQRVVRNVNTFTDCDACIDFIHKIRNHKACMIISGALGQQIVPRVHEMSQVDSIFIFCGNRERHEQWAKEWSKIKGVFTGIISICESLKELTQQVEQSATPISFVASGKRVDQLEPSFMYTQLIKEIILTIEFEDTHRQQYVNYCREIYANDQKQITHIKRLEQEYQKYTPIWWYTCDCFLYPMLNGALRSMQGDIIIEMGFFIKDLHQHIERLHKEQFGGESSQRTFTLYRGQGLTKTDFGQLQQSEGGLISFDSFLSTSYDRTISMNFACNAIRKPDQVGILFVMKINPAQSTTPFCSIAAHSAFPTEGEVLFSMHSVFRINDIETMSGDNRLYQVHVTLTGDNDPELSKLTHHIREESYPDESAWYRLGAVFLKMGQMKKAEEIYRTLLRRTTERMEKASINYQLGRVKYCQGDYKEAIVMYEKSLRFYQKSSSSDPLGLANLYNWMGNAYDSMGNYSDALKTHEKALAIRQQSLPPDHSDLAKSYGNIGLVYDRMGDYEKALSFHEKVLVVRQRSLPPNHPDLASSHNNIGGVYQSMGDYEKALSSQQKALFIRQQSLPPDHPDLASSFSNIGHVYNSMSAYEKALSSHRKALSIRRRALSTNHPDLASSYSNIGNVYRTMGDYEKALSSHEKALAIRQQNLPANHPDLASSYNNIGLVYSSMGDYEKALSYYQKDLALCQASLPPNHPDLASSHSNIGYVYNSMRDHEKAISSYEKALSIRQQSLPPNHPYLAMSFANIGNAYKEMDMHAKALPFCQNAVDIAQRTLSPEHPHLQHYQNNLADVKKKL